MVNMNKILKQAQDMQKKAVKIQEELASKEVEGSAGGGMVKSFIDQGDVAIGVEGSDYSLVRQREEWSKIPEYLFTADITKPFQIFNDNSPFLFDVITAWEFLEHIDQSDLQEVFNNIDNHLKNNGVVIASINMEDSYHHETVENEQWWIRFIEEQTAFMHNPNLLQVLAPRNFVRNLPNSFHVVLKRK